MMIILLVYLAVTACALTPNRAGTLQIRNDYESRNLDTISNIYNMTIFPNNLPVLKDGAKAVPPGLFNINATGRVTPIGNFSGFDDSIEYFFALAPVAGQNNLNTSFFSNDSSAVIREAKVVEFASGCPEIAASTVYLAIGMVNGSTSEPIGDLFTTLKQASFIAFWRFDDSGAVLDYDAWIPNLQAWTSIITGFDLSNRALQMAVVAAEVCPLIQQRCAGVNQQYDSVGDCMAKLESKSFGSFDEIWGDNIACRVIHLILTQMRPEVHCPHVGPNGGNGPDNFKCVDIDYSLDYFDDGALFGGSAFNCPGYPLDAQV